MTEAVMADVLTLDRVIRKIEERRGPFVLVGLLLREDSAGMWDLVISAPWLEKGKLKALGDFVKDVADAAGEGFVREFSRIVTLTRKDRALRAILDETRHASMPYRKAGRDLFGLPVEQAYVLRAAHRGVPHAT